MKKVIRILALMLTVAILAFMCPACGTAGTTTTTTAPAAQSSGTQAAAEAPATTETPAAPGAKLDYPKRSVDLIVCKGAGGPTDTVSRFLMEYCSKYDPNFSATIQNVTGANGITGMTKGALADGDGYTLAMIVVELAIMQNISSYNSAVTTDDFRPVSICVCNPDLICCKAGAYKDIYDFVDQLSSATKIGNAGTYGIGDLATKSVMAGWNKEYTSVPYADGDAAALQALIADKPEINAMVCAPSGALNSQIAAGNVQVLCVVGGTHIENVPDAPLISELKEGYSQDLSVNAWAGLAVPKDTPDDIYNYLVDLCDKATNDPEFVSEVNATGSLASAINGADAQAFLKGEAEHYAEVLKDVD